MFCRSSHSACSSRSPCQPLAKKANRSSARWTAFAGHVQVHELRDDVRPGRRPPRAGHRPRIRRRRGRLRPRRLRRSRNRSWLLTPRLALRRHHRRYARPTAAPALTLSPATPSGFVDHRRFSSGTSTRNTTSTRRIRLRSIQWASRCIPAGRRRCRVEDPAVLQEPVHHGDHPDVVAHRHAGEQRAGFPRQIRSIFSPAWLAR